MSKNKSSLPNGTIVFDTETFTPDFIEPGETVDICLVLQPAGVRHTSITARLIITYNIYEEIVRSILKDKFISHEELVKSPVPTKELIKGLARHMSEMDLTFFENMPSDPN